MSLNAMAQNVEISDLLPPPPNFNSSKISFYKLFKNVLIGFVVLGGLFMLVDRISNHFLTNTNSFHTKECDERKYEDIDKIERHALNVEKIGNDLNSCSGNVLNLLKEDVANLKDQVLSLWKGIDEKSPKCDLPEIDAKIKNAVLESKAVDKKIKKALDTYDADKLALYDYAAEYAGGEVVSIPETTPYPSNKITQIFGLLRLTYSSSPGQILKHETVPGDCFRFYGNRGRIIIKLGKKITVRSVTLEHSPLVEDISDAPKRFDVYTLNDSSGEDKSMLGSFEYDATKEESIQNFPIGAFPEPSEFVELNILSNHGNPSFTSIYRFRVHAGKKVT